jgi:serine/threonine-protein kinase
MMTVGLVFEVAGSLGIAASEYQEIVSGIQYADLGFGGFGLSWVSVWILVFTIVAPNLPRRALLAAALSASTVPLMFSISSVTRRMFVTLTAQEFFLALVFPYILIVGMAYVGARVVYRLGTEVAKARELGSYALVERLGSGGMGEVWRAQHRMLARPAAIKLVRPEVLGAADPESRRVIRRRFEQEAQVTATMRSPHTIALYDFGVAQDGAFYYVMELLDGFDLETLVEQFGPLPAARVVHLLKQICASLAEAHDHGLIHRDVKPANVYVCRYGRAFDFVKVLDFGMVKWRGDGEARDVKLTAENRVGGTPAYMAPEQVLGQALDGRTDLYAVGCLGYWLLTGQLVFEGQTVIDTMMQHVNADPPPPSQRSEIAIPPELERVMLSCLAKDPAARPQTADELTRLLEAVPLERPWTDADARSWWSRHNPA